MSNQSGSDADIARLVQTLSDNADPLHSDFTPAVHQLIQFRWQGAKAVLDLLDAPEYDIRLHAQRVLEGVVMYCHGWRPGHGYPGDPHQGQEKTQTLLEANGNYQADAPPAQRQAAIELWHHWIDTQAKQYSCEQEEEL